MSKIKKIYSASTHIQDSSHEVRVIQDEAGIRLKMTYESYNAIERFTGEQFINGKWEHTFSMLDLGVRPNKTMYILAMRLREERAEELFVLGTKLFNILNA